MPFKLPSISRVLQQTLQVLKPEDLERRQREQEETAEDVSEVLTSAGLVVGQEVAASHVLQIKGSTVAQLGSKAVVVAGDLVPGRITAKFDERLDGGSQCVHVLPSEIVQQLPAGCGLCIGERVVAAMDLFVGPTLLVRLGTTGIVECLTPNMMDLRVTVQFSERLDGSFNKVNVTPAEITPYCMLAGGFWPMQRVQSSSDLFAAGTMIVKAGVGGIICARYSETRFSVKFDQREDGSDAMVNVVPDEVILKNGAVTKLVARPMRLEVRVSLQDIVIMCGCSLVCAGFLFRRHCMGRTNDRPAVYCLVAAVGAMAASHL